MRNRASRGRGDLAPASASRCISMKPQRDARIAGGWNAFGVRASTDKPPDIGDIAAHPSAGASVIGARDFLIAFNVNLATADAAIARTIARKIRESSGGFPFVKAMGRYLPSRNCAQVSMNLTNFAATPLDAAVCGNLRGSAEVCDPCQLVGFIPRRAFEMSPDFFRAGGEFRRIAHDRNANRYNEGECWLRLNRNPPRPAWLRAPAPVGGNYRDLKHLVEDAEAAHGVRKRGVSRISAIAGTGGRLRS